MTCAMQATSSSAKQTLTAPRTTNEFDGVTPFAAMVHWILPETVGAPPDARGGCACASIGSQVYFFGGANRLTQAFNDLWMLDTSNSLYEWKCVPTTCAPGLNLHARSGATITVIGDRLYIYGGQDIISGMCFGDIICLDMSSWQWSRVEVAGGQQPMPRHSHCAGKLADNCFMIFGGAGESEQMNDVWIFNVEQRGWTSPPILSQKPCPREMHSGTMVDQTTLLVYGGRGSNGRVLDDVAIFDAKEMKWRCIEPTPFARVAHTGVLIRRQDVLDLHADSQDSPHVHDPEPMDTDSDAGGNVVLVYGGYSGESIQGNVFYIDPVTTEIEVIKREPRPSDAGTSTMPAPRFAHCAAAVPSTVKMSSQEMVVFGGVNPSDDLNDIAVLRGGEEDPVEQGVIIEELSSTAAGHKLKTKSTTIQHAEGLVELQISEEP